MIKALSLAHKYCSVYQATFQSNTFFSIVKWDRTLHCSVNIAQSLKHALEEDYN